MSRLYSSTSSKASGLPAMQNPYLERLAGGGGSCRRSPATGPPSTRLITLATGKINTLASNRRTAFRAERSSSGRFPLADAARNHRLRFHKPIQTAVRSSTEDYDAATSDTDDLLSHDVESESIDSDGYTEVSSVAIGDMESNLLEDAYHQTDNSDEPYLPLLQPPNGTTVSTEDLARALLAAQFLSADSTSAAQRQQNGSLAGNIDADDNSQSNGVAHSIFHQNPVGEVGSGGEGQNGRAMFRLSKDGNQREVVEGGQAVLGSATLAACKDSTNVVGKVKQVSRHAPSSRPPPSRDDSRSSVKPEVSSGPPGRSRVAHPSRRRDADVAPPSVRRRKAYRNVFLGAAMWQTHVEKAMDALFRNELTRRAAVTVALLLLSRLGFLLPVPGIAPGAALAASMLHPEDAMGFDMSLAGSSATVSLFSLGISPYIFANICIQVLLMIKVIPHLNNLRNEGFAGAQVIKRYVFYISAAFALLVGFATSLPLVSPSSHATWQSSLSSSLLPSLSLAGGALLLNLISEAITEHGLGDGFSLLVCLSILTSFVQSFTPALMAFVGSLQRQGIRPSLLSASVVSLSLFSLTFVAALLVGAARRVPLRYFDFAASPSRSQQAEVQPALPFPLIPHGMYPLFSTSMMIGLFQYMTRLSGFTLQAPAFLMGASHHIASFVLTALFNTFDVEDSVKEMSMSLGSIGAGIPGVRPGVATADFLRNARDSSRFLGGMLLALLALISSYATDFLQASFQFSVSCTSLLILVGSIISLCRTIESYLQAGRMLKAMSAFKVPVERT